MLGRKRGDKSYTKVTRFYFRAYGLLPIRLYKSEIIKWE